MDSRPLTLTLFCLFVVARFAPAAPTGGRNEKAIAAVAAGTIQVAKASWWGFDPDDSTRALQAAIDSGVPKVVVDNVGKPWVVTGITLVSNQEVFFEKGVEVLAKKGAFRGTGDCLFRADLKENIFLNGYGATLRMRRSDYDAPPYKKAEWRHCLSIKSCKNVRVFGLTLAESGGDGIYLGTAKEGVTNLNVHVKEVTCDKNYRQGVSVITAENLLLENCVLKDTGGTPPQAGIDFEPNHATERLVNCTLRDCLIENNAGDGIAIYIPTLHGDSTPVSLRFERCKSAGNQGSAVDLYTGNTPDKAVKGRIEFVDCTLAGSRHCGIMIGDKPVDGCKVRFRNCSILDVALKAPLESPLMFASRAGAEEPVGGVEFAECVVRDPVDRHPLGFLTMGEVQLKDVTGTLILEKNGTRSELRLTPELLHKWMPFTGLKPIPRVRLKGLTLKPLVGDAPATRYSPGAIRLRTRGRFVLFARGGDEVRLRVYSGQVGKYSGRPLPVVVTGPTDKVVKRSSIPFKQEGEVTFTAPVTGLYRVTADPGANYVQVTASSHPLAVDGSGGPVHFYSTQTTLFFWVPAGTTEFGVRVFGEGAGEGVKAALIDPTGNLVEEKDNILRTYQFVATLPAPSKGGAWRLRMARPSAVAMEDHYVDLRGVPPLLAPSREGLLVPGKP